MSLLKKFPEQCVPRQIQNEILKDVESKIKSGYKKIILCAPTGVGKSFIGAAIANYFGSSFVVTATKHLQDQYSKDLPFLLPVKGKQNFACHKMMESEKVTISRRALRWGLTCDKGECLEKKIQDGKEIIEVCKFKPKIKDVEAEKFDENTCEYYLQKYKALISSHSLWNYHAYFQIMKYNYKNFEDYLDRKVSIFDEAHKIEEQIIQFVGIDIFKGQFDECGLEVKNYDLSDIDSIVILLDNMSDFYARKIQEIKESTSFQERIDYEVLSKLERKYERVSKSRVEIVSDKENFVVNDPEKDFYGDFRSVSTKPIDVSKFTNSLFNCENQVFMSATIDKESFCENLGIEQSSAAFVDSPKSPFPVESRKIEFLNISRLSYGATAEDESEVIKKIDEILSKHSKERGLILTSSVSRCYRILKELSPKNRERVRVCHSINRDKKTQIQILKEHREDRSGVLLSSSLWEGVDLKDDLSRFQIIAKVPYPNYNEKRINVKMEKFPLWYTSQTLTKLLQGFGRSVRSEDDWAITYVLDSAINNILYKARNMIPQSFHDVLPLEN